MKSLEVYMWSTCTISLDFLDLRECCEIFKIIFFSSFEMHGWNKQISAPQIKNIPKKNFRSHVNVLARFFSAPANGIYFAENLPAAPPGNQVCKSVHLHAGERGDKNVNFVSLIFDRFHRLTLRIRESSTSQPGASTPKEAIPWVASGLQAIKRLRKSGH